jgi:adenylate cyclase
MLNRFSGAEIISGDVDWVLSGVPVQKLLIWSVMGGVILGLFSGIFEYLFSSKTFSRLNGSQLIGLKSITYLTFFVIIALIGFYGLIDELEAPGKPSSFWAFLLSESSLPIIAHLILTSILVNSFIYVERIVGRSKFANIVSGQYQDPKKENLIFMFLDLKDSTTLAEKWGQYKTAKFFQEYYGDLSELIYPYKGSLYQYVGDEAVITWKLKDEGNENFNSIAFFYAFKKVIEGRKKFYQDEYGIIPQFKAGVHCGKVTITEIGKYQIDIAYHGDVLNTTARMTSECRILGKDLLISETLYENLKLPDEYSAEGVGEAQFRGKELYTNLFYIWPTES